MSKGELPKIDVVLPFHRIDDYLVQSVKSIHSQQNVDANLILVDDRVQATPSFQLIRDTDTLIHSGGVGYRKALQLGIRTSQRRYLAFQDSDDFSHPNRLSLQYQKLASEKVAIVGCKLAKIDDQNYLKLSAPQISGSVTNNMNLLLGSQGANSSWLIDNEKIDKKLWMTLHTQAPDWEIAFSILAQETIFVINKYLYFYRQHQGQLTRDPNYELEHFQEIYSFWEMVSEQNRLPKLSVREARLFATGRSAYVKLSNRIFAWIFKLCISKQMSFKQRMQTLTILAFRLGRNESKKHRLYNICCMAIFMLIVNFWYTFDLAIHPRHYYLFLRRKKIV